MYATLIMIPKEQLQDKADRMNKYLQEKASDEPNDIIDRINNLSVLISQSGEYLAAANYYKDALISSEIMRVMKEGIIDKLSMTAINKLVNSLAKEESFLVNQLDRINSAGVHQLDGLRSVLSYRKIEFSALSYIK